eukprot:TRINITY_DN9314_c0_g2_i2.p1 TRINITY_DN9314_c0_g2~~TRINITY_DN9314_c0_g2_i2.p1  ORF type:complete len:640 (+),score=65.70 TRINITY_DN9314_c0_g2_i2:83-2002(+)
MDAGEQKPIVTDPTPSEDGGNCEIGSGHSLCRKMRFAGTLSAIYLGLALASPAKDFYLEKLGAHPLVMGVVFFIVSFLSPVNEIISGRLQARGRLARCFPVEKWGRKAPWLLTHVGVLALAAGALYLPPSRDPVVVHVWLYKEIYPYNEERAGVEFLCKIAVAIGIAVAALPLLVLLSNSAFWLRASASVLFFVCTLCMGLQARDIWIEAKSPNLEGETPPSICRDFKLTWGNWAFRQLVCVRLWEGLYQGLQATNLWYYITYLMQLHGVARSLAVVGIGALNMFADTVVAFFVGRLMDKRENSFKIQTWVITCRTVDAALTVFMGVLPVLIAGAGPHAKGSSGLAVERAFFVVWITVNRALQGPFTFWRVGAQCWVVDEDNHAANGERREAAYISVGSAAQNFTRAFAGAVGFLGYGLAGLAPKDCEMLCAGSPEEENFNCLDPCMGESIISQPDTLRWYIRLINILGLVISELLLVYHTSAFPIKGVRLMRLYHNQTNAYGGVVDAGSAAGQIRRLSKKLKPGLHDLINAQHSESVVVTGDSPRAGMAHVSNLQAHNVGGSVSTSVIFSNAVLSMMDAIPARNDTGKDIPQEDSLTSKRPSEFPPVVLLRSSGPPAAPEVYNKPLPTVISGPRAAQL